MSKKFIPNGDMEFAQMAESFAHTIAKEPARFDVSQADSDELSTSVQRYRATLNKCRSSARSAASTRAKEDARADAERIIRRLGHVVRANVRIDAATKILLGIRPRVEKAKQVPCPIEPPRLAFERALHERGAVPVHELKFSKLHEWHKTKPPGAVRLELFVDLIPPDEPVPAHPGANYGGRPWYLRSFTRSPIRLTPPIARVPMRVVYWGRWADSMGNVGPFSATAVAWIEGGSHHWLPGGTSAGIPDGGGGLPRPIPEASTVTTIGPATRERTYVVAVLEAQYQTIVDGRAVEPASLPAPLPAPEGEREQRQLEAPPAKSEAA